MITFNSLQLSDDRNFMLIDCQITDTETYPNAYIDKIYIEYYKNRLALKGPSDFAVQVYDAETAGEQLTHVSLTGDDAVPASVLAEKPGIGTESFVGGLFYALVVWKDTDEIVLDSGEVSCAYGAVLDWEYVYERGMAAVASIAAGCNRNACEPPLFFEQFVIVWHALSLSVEAKDFDMVDKLWGRFVSIPSSVPGPSTCNCG